MVVIAMKRNMEKFQKIMYLFALIEISTILIITIGYQLANRHIEAIACYVGICLLH